VSKAGTLDFALDPGRRTTGELGFFIPAPPPAVAPLRALDQKLPDGPPNDHGDRAILSTSDGPQLIPNFLVGLEVHGQISPHRIPPSEFD
jgi:hypothetical protein